MERPGTVSTAGRNPYHMNPSQERLLLDMSCWKLLHMMQAACQSLEICLVDAKDSGCSKAPIFPDNQAAATPAPGCMPGQLTMTFPPECLERFLSACGDTNPIHFGPNAVIPGLWILSRLEELYGSHSPGQTLSIRFLRPVHAGSSVRLIHKNNVVTGAMSSITCFAMTIHTPDQTQKRR